MGRIQIYKSILEKLDLIPVDYLVLVDAYLSSLNKNLSKKEENRKVFLALAGSWSDMNKDDFEDFLQIMQGSLY